MSKALTTKQQKDILATLTEIERIIKGNDDPEEENPKATRRKKRLRVLLIYVVYLM